MPNYDFEITIKRMLGKSALGTRLVFNGTQDLEEIFTPKVTAMILKEWARKLEERQTIIQCPYEKARANNEF
nr:hypothetical protein [Candidatus Aenigmarchaeota archaeon]